MRDGGWKKEEEEEEEEDKDDNDNDNTGAKGQLKRQEQASERATEND